VTAPASENDGAMRDLATAFAARSELASTPGRDVFARAERFTVATAARDAGLYPFFLPLDGSEGPEVIFEGRRVLMLGSNNYLGLTTHPRVRAAAAAAIERFGTSMTGSPLMNGTSRLHRELEERLAAWHRKEAAIVFSTGYHANLAAISALLSARRSTALVDRSAHASIYDGIRLAQATGARMVRFPHDDPASLDAALSGLGADDGALVVTEGVFSTDGGVARLPELVRVARRHRARVLVDDAHGLGVMGPEGRGTVAHYQLEDEVDLVSGTFSKTLASVGGWLVGPRSVLDYIRHFASPLVFSASAPPASVAAATAALDVLRDEPWLVTRLLENANFFREELKTMGFDVGKSDSAIVPVVLRDDQRTILMWRELFEVHGIYTNPFFSPGVPVGQALLRTSCMATHTTAHLERALDAFRDVGRRFGVIPAGA